MPIATIAEQAALIIAAATPTREPLITYREGRLDIPLEQQRPTLSPSETTRQFQIFSLSDPSFTRKWKRTVTSSYLEQTLELKIRYQIPPEDNGYKRLMDLSATDSARILADLTQPPSSTTWGSNTVLREIENTSTQSRPVPIFEMGPHLWLHVMTFRVQYAMT